MPTTTVRLPEELKARVARAAEHAGMTSHALILDAIAEKVDEVERRNDFHTEAESRYAKLIASGKAIPWSEMRTYLENRSAGKQASPPRAKKPAR